MLYPMIWQYFLTNTLLAQAALSNQAWSEHLPWLPAVVWPGFASAMFSLEVCFGAATVSLEVCLDSDSLLQPSRGVGGLSVVLTATSGGGMPMVLG